MKLLTDVEVDEVSPVRRAANRRRFILKEDGEELGVDAEIADIMADPWEHEGAMLDGLRAAGADETVQKAAVAAVRLLKGVEEDLPAPMQELIEKLGREQYPVANGPLNTRKDDDEEPDDDEDDEDGVTKDSSAPYGNVTYADPGYQSDGQKRYPLDSETHIRAAWSYINMPKNAAKYSGSQVAQIKGRIRAAMKRIGANVSKSEEEIEEMLDATPLTGWTLARLKKTFRKSQDNRAASPDDPGDTTNDDEDADSDDDNSVQKGDPVGTHVGPVQKEDGTWDLDGVPEEQRPALEVILKAQTALTEKLTSTEERLAKSEDALATRQFIAKAENEFDSLAPADKLGPILKEAADKLSPETVEALEAVLKGANARVETGALFQELGRAALDDGPRDDPWSQIEKAADEMVEKSGDLTHEQAIDRVLKTAEGKRLYAQYMAGEGRSAMAANSLANGGVA